METVTEEFKIRGMVCNRCLKVLNNELRAAGIDVLEVSLGKIRVRYSRNKSDRELIHQIIHDNEFEVLVEKESILGDKTKRMVIEYVWNGDYTQNLSEYLSCRVNANYDLLSRNFTRTYGKTIERYNALLKVERAKEFIGNGQLIFSEIAYALGYQNLSALSRQFKRETGMTLREYKKLAQGMRISIDKI